MNIKDCLNIKKSTLVILITVQLIAVFAISRLAYGKQLTIAMSLNNNEAALLERVMNNKIKNTDLVKKYYFIKIIPAESYDKKRTLLLNNEIDIIDVGFGQYYEAGKIQRYNVILHFCYLNDFTEMFYISGIIFCNKYDNVSIKDIPKRTIYAVSPSSSSGYLLQKIYLVQNDIDINVPIFVKSHKQVPLYVEKNKGSVGFCASFINLNPEKFKVIYCSKKVPANIVIAKENIDEATLQEITHVLLECFNTLFLGRGGRFLVYKIEDDYDKYLKYYKSIENARTMKGKAITLSIIFISIILLAGIIYLAKKLAQRNKEIKELKDRTLNYFIKESGYEKIIKELESYPVVKKLNLLTYLEEALSYYGLGKYRNEIEAVAKPFENIIDRLIDEIEKNHISEEWSFEKRVNKDKKLITFQIKVSFINSFINQFIRSKISKSRNINGDEPYKDLADENIKKIFPLATLDGIIWTLYAYRNLTVHNHKYFCKEIDAKFVIENYITFIQKLNDTALLNE